MERLKNESPEDNVVLTDAQKKELAEIDQRYRAKIAERQVFLQKKLEEATANNDLKEIDAIERQLRDERLRLEEECESKKDVVRKASGFASR